jgi:hypothetical protein
VDDVESLQRSLQAAVSCACCCQCAPELGLPVYKVLQGFLISYGGFGSPATCTDLERYTAKLRAQVLEENRELTREFYMAVCNFCSIIFCSFVCVKIAKINYAQEYGFPTYDETMYAHCGGGASNPHTPSAPDASVYAPTVVVATAVPVTGNGSGFSYAPVAQPSSY